MRRPFGARFCCIPHTRGWGAPGWKCLAPSGRRRGRKPSEPSLSKLFVNAGRRMEKHPFSPSPGGAAHFQPGLPKPGKERATKYQAPEGRRIRCGKQGIGRRMEKHPFSPSPGGAAHKRRQARERISTSPKRGSGARGPSACRSTSFAAFPWPR